uniref:Integrase catalytic domain-containing protein n=1 Tax=Heterorhabditis bacteriophora TaxID=37862 RepID=A0A1I7WFJ0_HETBA
MCQDPVLKEVITFVHTSKWIKETRTHWNTENENVGERFRYKCQENAKMPIKKDLNTWPIESTPWNRVHIDYAGALKGKMYLMVVDTYSKWPEMFEMSSCTFVTTIRKLRSLFTQFGNPQILVSDNGTCFSSTEFKDFCDAKGIKHVHSPPFDSQSNEQVERFVDTFKRALKKLDGEGVGTQEAIETFLQTYRRSPCSATPGEQSLVELFLERPIRTTLILLNTTNPYTSTQHSENMEKRLRYGAAIFDLTERNGFQELYDTQTNYALDSVTLPLRSLPTRVIPKIKHFQPLPLHWEQQLRLLPNLESRPRA